MVFLYDGTWNGLLCCQNAVALYGLPDQVVNRESLQLSLFTAVNDIPTREQLAVEEAAKLSRQLGTRHLRIPGFAFLSGEPQTPAEILHYWNLGLQDGVEQLANLNHPLVRRMVRQSRAVRCERHRLLGLIRFRESQGILYAPYESRFDLLATLPSFFMGRMPQERFILHDRLRQKAAFCGDSRWILVSGPDLKTLSEQTPKEDPWVPLWKTFFREIAVPGRISPARQQSRMPGFYWGFLPEKQKDAEASF